MGWNKGFPRSSGRLQAHVKCVPGSRHTACAQHEAEEEERATLLSSPELISFLLPSSCSLAGAPSPGLVVADGHGKGKRCLWSLPPQLFLAGNFPPAHLLLTCSPTAPSRDGHSDQSISFGFTSTKKLEPNGKGWAPL